MEAFIKHTGQVAPLNRANVDTDQILPKQFLTRIERTGFGQYLFFDWRYNEQGEPDPQFVLNNKEYQQASILVTGRNFGSGSSREHAPWALLDYGFRVIIAPSFADIFFNNCFKNGILPIVLEEKLVEEILMRTEKTKGYRLTVDLEKCCIFDSDGFYASFVINPHRRNSLLNGLDEIGVILQFKDKIEEYENRYNEFYRLEWKEETS
ncbi:3-isopropylmalate dehydratase small subunit [Aneurinibacillus tyrosinisolvens]|uniref:3-isopropylmalate dehydratase small subunit n=1 Tax=Aneurinibacillus tyrosinisolvens TaxID=1443435 RepID=UPI00063F7D55|nr:3-isopropylmalate dehydratase small subunit [Aneurinibacillus tyrosinisolvens]